MCFCEVDDENSFHILIECDYSFSLWSKFLSFWDIGWVFPNSLARFFDQWTFPSSSLVLQWLWDLMTPHIPWGLWKEINNRIFRESKLQVDSLFYQDPLGHSG